MLTEPTQVETAITETDSAPPVRTRRQKIIAACAAAGAFLSCYVLSAGPMAGIHKAIRFQPIQTAIEIGYAPIVFVVKHEIEPFSSVLKSYIGMFQ